MAGYDLSFLVTDEHVQAYTRDTLVNFILQVGTGLHITGIQSLS